MKFLVIFMFLFLVGCQTTTSGGAPGGYMEYCAHYPQDIICGGTGTR